MFPQQAGSSGQNDDHVRFRALIDEELTDDGLEEADPPPGAFPTAHAPQRSCSNTGSGSLSLPPAPSHKKPWISIADVITPPGDDDDDDDDDDASGEQYDTDEVARIGQLDADVARRARHDA